MSASYHDCEPEYWVELLRDAAQYPLADRIALKLIRAGYNIKSFQELAMPDVPESIKTDVGAAIIRLMLGSGPYADRLKELAIEL